MRKYFRNYIKLIAAQIEDIESGKIPAEMLDNRFFEMFRRMIAQMQHERLIHLLVTMLFALLTVMTLGFVLINPSPAVCALFILFLIPLVPYVEHYYFLENGCQKLYKYYDKCETLIFEATKEKTHDENAENP
jgi:Ca2+/Na+ antiporter